MKKTIKPPESSPLDPRLVSRQTKASVIHFAIYWRRGRMQFECHCYFYIIHLYKIVAILQLQNYVWVSAPSFLLRSPLTMQAMHRIYLPTQRCSFQSVYVSSVLADYYLGGTFIIENRWRPIRPQTGASQTSKSMLK